MARTPTAAERATKKEMSRAYKAQEHDSDGWPDWREFTAHVVHGLLDEVAELRQQLSRHGLDPGSPRDPFEK